MNFSVPGKPQPQQRRVVLSRFLAYDPPESKKAKKLVAQYAQIALQGAKDSFLGPYSERRVKVILRFYGARKNADLDNLYKLITDACQGILYKNDCQIDIAEIYRHPAIRNSERTEVEIFAL